MLCVNTCKRVGVEDFLLHELYPNICVHLCFFCYPHLVKYCQTRFLGILNWVMMTPMTCDYINIAGEKKQNFIY